ncbi:hypothetical protein NDI54_09275 [Haloarcula sp. S1AR25-5A]|uniref:Acc operon protein n=1 Tax=Haloarcula terrestris TaxID=2950533 RepID=A0AAE4JGK9_9EURY|nr:hypothetical protein [Haloarcula terrestris]MDS0221538.1 hypothetical protein [Haloarcula terrestris]
MAARDSSQPNVEAAPTADGTATDDLSLSIPADASQAEAAAISAAVSAYVTDRQRAAVAAHQRDSVEYADEWTLAGRLASVGKRRQPTKVERGEEWKAAARAPY